MAWIQKTDINPATGKQYGINPNTGVWDDNYFANVTEKQWLTSPAGQAAQNERTQTDATNLLGTQATNQANLLAKQKAEQEAFLNKYTTGMDTARSALSTELGLPELRQNTQIAGQTARDVSRTMQDLPQALTATGRAASINQSRLTRGIAQRTSEMQPALEAARRAAEDTGAAQSFAETEYTKRLQEKAQPYQLEASMLSEGLAREMTGFTQQSQNELTVILQKLQNNQALTMAEVNRANALADSEAAFEREKEVQKAKQSAPITLSQGETVYDPTTNKSLFTAPKLTTLGEAPGKASSVDPYQEYSGNQNNNNFSNSEWSVIPDWAFESATAYNKWLSSQ